MYQIAMSVFGQYGIQTEISTMQHGLHHQQIDLHAVRQEMRAIEYDQHYQSELLNAAMDDISFLFNSVDGIQEMLDKAKAFSAAIFAMTNTGFQTLSDELLSFDRKLMQISTQIGSVKNINFETDIASVFRKVYWRYTTVVDQIQHKELLSGPDMRNLLMDCNDLIITLINLRQDLPPEVVFDMLLYLLPMFTSLIIQYYRHFYNQTKRRDPLHSEWMKIYDDIQKKGFVEYYRDYLLINRNFTNRQTIILIDEWRLNLMKAKRKINNELAELDKCEDVNKHQLIVEKSEQASLQVLQEYEARVKEQLSETETEQFFEPVRVMCKYAPIPEE